MIFTTKHSVDGYRITGYLCNLVMEDSVSETASKTLKDMRKDAFQEMQSEAEEMGADAVIGVDTSYRLSEGETPCPVFFSISGTVVTLEEIGPSEWN